MTFQKGNNLASREHKEKARATRESTKPPEGMVRTPRGFQPKKVKKKAPKKKAPKKPASKVVASAPRPCGFQKGNTLAYRARGLRKNRAPLPPPIAPGEILTPAPDPHSQERAAVVMDQPWKYLPHTLAMHVSEGKWVPYAYLVFVSHVIATVMAQGGGRIIVEWPPRHGKSMFLSQYLPVWFLANWPDQSIILATYEANFASSWGRKVRNLVSKYGDELGVHVSNDSAAAAYWATTEGGGMVTAGVGGPVTGKGGKLVLVDDPHKNWQEAMSATICQGIHDWFDSTLYTRLEPGGTLVVTHTRWAQNDLIGYLLDQHPEENWIVVRFPALAEEEDILGRKIGAALCPERYNEQALAKIQKVLGSQMWNGLYQQRPAAIEGDIWKRERWRYYRADPVCSFVIQSWDTGFKRLGENTSYTVCQTWGVFPSGYCLLNQWRARVEWPELEKMAKAQFAAWRPNAVLIEDKGSGQSLIQALQRNTPIPVIPVNPQNDGDKVVRAMAVTPLHEAGLLYLQGFYEDDEGRMRAEPPPWVTDLVDRFANFPNGNFKDEIDATSQALAYLRDFSAVGEIQSAVARVTGAKLEGFRQLIGGSNLKL